MKILTGNLCGRTIAFKPNRHLRPTSDKAKKAIFDMLQGQLKNKSVLDLFSGTGSLGFEALSQGADFVTFVEIEKSQAALIRSNSEKLGAAQRSEVIVGDVISVIKNLARDKKEFDFIFMDPPYDVGLGEKTLKAIFLSTIVKKDTLIVVESRDKETLPDLNENFMLIKNKTYGDTRIVIYQRV